MVGVTSVTIHESLDELTQQLQQAHRPTDKERLQVLHWLKQENAPSISTIAKALGQQLQHRANLVIPLPQRRHCGDVGDQAALNRGSACDPAVGTKQHWQSGFSRQSMGSKVMDRCNSG